MPGEVILSEKCGPFGTTINYIRNRKDNTLERVKVNEGYVKNSFLLNILECLRELLLPIGYPDSVSEDYLEYQIWDTVQAFCSTITGIFTTQAILKGVGVGDAAATPLSATITWILKDGSGMIGRILFAWWKGSNLDCDCKKWRLFADIINDGAMILDLCVPHFTDMSLQILCMSTVLRSLVGVAGSATRASISNHQAIKDNNAEVSAKDGSQETIVNLIASFTGLFLLQKLQVEQQQWVVVFVFMLLHLFANYKAVCAIIFNSLNNARINLIIKTFLNYNAVLGPKQINRLESVFLGFTKCTAAKICGFDIKMGKSLKQIDVTNEELSSLMRFYQSSNYLIVTDVRKMCVFVVFERGETPRTVIGAYYRAILVAFATQIYNRIQIDMPTKKRLHYSAPISRLQAVMKTVQLNNYPHEFRSLSVDALQILDEYFKSEIELFFTALNVNGWDIDQHSLYLDEWRIEWHQDDKKLL